MNAPTRGVLLAVVGMILAVVVLGQGFGTTEPTLEPTVSAGSAEESGDGSSSENGEEAGADDAGTAGASGDSAVDDSTNDDGSPVIGEPVGDDDSTGDDSGTADTGPDILHPQAEVRVLVANGAGIAGLAGRTRDLLVSAQNYNGITPTNTKITVTESAVYYTAGYQLDARNIAKILNASPEAVAAMPTELPIDDLAQAHVLVVVAADLAPEG
jgi:hypothetical protein